MFKFRANFVVRLINSIDVDNLDKLLRFRTVLKTLNLIHFSISIRLLPEYYLNSGMPRKCLISVRVNCINCTFFKLNQEIANDKDLEKG